jgi:hypothetical protein
LQKAEHAKGPNMRNKLVVTAGGLVLAAALGVSPAAQAAASHPAPGGAVVGASRGTPARAASSAVCKHGGRVLTPTAVRTDTLGVKYYTYRAVPGMITKVPPRGLTAARITPALLADIGLESASAARKALTPAAKQRLDRAAIVLSTGGAPKLCAGTAKDRGLLGGQLTRRITTPSPARFNIYSGNWGGYGIDASEFGGAINAAEGAWNVGRGTTSGTAQYPSAGEATWVGVGSLDDSGTTGLIQAGVSIITDPRDTQTAGGYTSWIEAISNNGTGCAGDNNGCNPIYNAADSTRPGDAMLVRSYYTSSAQACFVVVDYTHSSGSIPDACEAPAVYDHTSGEWINENLLANGYLYNNPGTISFNTQNVSGAFGGGSWSQAFTGQYQTVIMETSRLDNDGVSTCPGNSVLLSKGVNASGQASQIATYAVNGCDQ